jgi:hypothetical protein
MRKWGTGAMAGVLLLAVAAGAYAQEQSRADAVVARMKADLNLSEAQVQAINPIIEERMAQQREIRQGMKDGTMDRNAVREQIMKLDEAINQKLAAVLTPDQMQQWKEQKVRRRQTMRGGFRRHGHASEENAEQ